MQSQALLRDGALRHRREALRRLEQRRSLCEEIIRAQRQLIQGRVPSLPTPRASDPPRARERALSPASPLPHRRLQPGCAAASEGAVRSVPAGAGGGQPGACHHDGPPGLSGPAGGRPGRTMRPCARGRADAQGGACQQVGWPRDRAGWSPESGHLFLLLLLLLIRPKASPSSPPVLFFCHTCPHPGSEGQGWPSEISLRAPDALPGAQATRQCHWGCLADHGWPLGTQHTSPPVFWGSQPRLQPQTLCVPVSPRLFTQSETKSSNCPLPPFLSPGQHLAQA